MEENEALKLLETASMPELEADGRGQKIGRCPEKPQGVEFYCWKFHNPDPTAKCDFWMLFSLQRYGDMLLATKLIPQENGGFLRYVRFNEYVSAMQSKYIQELRQTSTSYGGVVNISRMKVRYFYEGVQQSLYTSKFKIYRYDSNWNLLGLDEAPIDYKFPPLPEGKPDATRGADAAFVLSQLDTNQIAPKDTIRFPKYEVDPAGEIVVDEGDEYKVRGAEGLSLANAQRTREPGVYIDFSQQPNSNPSMIMEIYSQVNQDGSWKFLFGSHCTSYENSYAIIREHVFVKKKKNWFRAKKKIRIIREEIRIVHSGIKCADL
jgi:hypothetical protein